MRWPFPFLDYPARMVKMLKPRVSSPSPSKVKPATVQSLRRERGDTWMRKRAETLERDKGLCQPCKRAGRLQLAAEVDHIVELADGGNHGPDNREAICIPCHRAKTAAAAAARRSGS